MFSQPESAQISKAYVAVRLLGGDDLNDEARAFAQRYGVQSYPTMLAMSPSGAVLTRAFQRDVPGILAAMETASDVQRTFAKRAAELAGKTDAASIRELAGLHKKRLEFDLARKGYEQLIAQDPTLADQSELLSILQAVGDADAGKALLKSLVQSHPQDARAITWRIALALAEIPKAFASREERESARAQRMTALTELLATVEATGDQAAVRLELARTLNRTRNREEALEHWEWILEHARDSTSAAEALMRTAGALFRGARGDAALLEEIRLLLQEIVEKHPKHPSAADAKRYIVSVEKSIEKARADDAAKKDPGG